jgi:hypothetical protein
MTDLFHTISALPAAAIYSAVLILFSGCSGSSQEAQVSGQVRLDGNVIGPGTVVFEPIGDGKPALGPIEADGSYSVSTSHEVGLGAGKYKVAISIREVPATVKRGDLVPPGKLLIPQKYEDTATSGLEYEVVPGSNTIDINLNSQSSSLKVFNQRSQVS